MTNEQIQEAAKLIREVEQLERLSFGKKDELVLARRREVPRLRVLYPGAELDEVTDVPLSLGKELLDGIIARKKARLNDLRAGC
jgi:hypothetical protein